MAQRPDSGKERFWLDRLQLWLQTRPRLTVREFCARHHLSEPSFYSWRRLLQERGLLDLRAKATPAPANSTTPAFVKLAVAAEATPPSAATALEVVLGDNRVLRVRPGFDPATLRDLVRLLEEPSC